MCLIEAPLDVQRRGATRDTSMQAEGEWQGHAQQSVMEFWDSHDELATQISTQASLLLESSSASSVSVADNTVDAAIAEMMRRRRREAARVHSGTQASALQVSQGAQARAEAHAGHVRDQVSVGQGRTAGDHIRAAGMHAAEPRARSDVQVQASLQVASHGQCKQCCHWQWQ